MSAGRFWRKAAGVAAAAAVVSLLALGCSSKPNQSASEWPDHAADHKHDTDPHVWLSPDHAVLMVNTIRDALKEADPAHAAGYDQRAAAYVAKLTALKTYGVDKFKSKRDNRLVSFHDSLAYF